MARVMRGDGSANEEYVMLLNGGRTERRQDRSDLAGGGRGKDRPSFPGATGGATLTLRPGQAAFVFTGHGTNERLSDGDLLLFWGRNASVRNNTGDVAYLRNPGGTFIDYMTVGEPKRHPSGHRRRCAA